MLVSGGKILALGKVSADKTLKGLGTPDSPLGINNPEQYAQKEWVENTFVSADYLEKNYWTSAATSAAVEARIRQIPGATEYSGGNGIKVDNYIISLQESAFNPYAKKQWVQDNFLSAVPEEYATKDFVNSADGIIKTWIENNYWTSSATSAEIARQLADFGGFEPVASLPTSGDPKKIYLIHSSDVGDDQYKEYIWNNNNWLCIGDTSMDLTPYAKTDWVSGELDKKVNTADFNSYKTEIEQALADKLDKDEFDTYSAGIATALGNKLDKDDFEAWSAHAFDDYAKTNDVNAKFDETSAWAKGTFVSANEFTEYKNTVADALAGKLDKSDFDTYSGGIDDDLRNISASLDNKLNRSETTEWDVTPYIGTEGIKVDAETHEISVSADFVTSQELQTSLEGYYTKDQTSGAQALADEFAKYQPSGNYITSAAADEKYIPKTWSAEKDFTPYSGGEGIKIEDHTISLSSVPQTVQLTSEDESVTINTDGPDEHGVITYDLSVPATAAEVNISGENGVSAKYDAEASAWKIGLEEQTYEYLEAKETDTTTVTAAKQVLNNFNAITVIGSNISVVDGQITFGNTGLYHIDMQVDVTVADTDLSYYTVLLELANYNNPTIGATIKATTHEIDWSYEHTETINVSFDFRVTETGKGTAIVISQLPLQGKASVRVRNLNIHEVVTIDSIFDGDAPVYTEGEAISITDGADGKAINVKFDSASGLGLNTNGQLVVKLGKGLKFDDTEGAVEGTLVLDDVTEEVVETVQNLQVELEGKLTVNMNVSDAKNVGSPFYNGSSPCLGAALFTVPLNHKLNTDSEVSFFTSQAMNQSNSFPIMIGILEYDFAYMDPDFGKRARTKWIADTGLIWSDTPAVDGNTIGDNAAGANRKYTFKLKNLTPVIEEEVTIGGVKYINKVGPELRPDRAYYLVMFSRAPQGLEYFLSDQGYATPTNSNPLLSFYCDNMNYYEYDGAEGQAMSQWSDATWQSHANDLAMSAIDFWHRGGEANTIYRPFVMIRNNV